ncbi:MAG: hypothetical protein ACK5LL_14960 [Suipraeoptans sp.]
MSVLVIINIIFSADSHNILKNIFSKQPVNYNIGVSVGMIISTLVIIIVSVFTVRQITKNALNEENNSNKSKKVIISGVIGAAAMTFFIVIWKLNGQILFSVNIFLAIAILIVFYIVHRVLSGI